MSPKSPAKRKDKLGLEAYILLQIELTAMPAANEFAVFDIPFFHRSTLVGAKPLGFFRGTFVINQNGFGIRRINDDFRKCFVLQRKEYSLNHVTCPEA